MINMVLLYRYIVEVNVVKPWLMFVKLLYISFYIDIDMEK